jgi:hypothetical protein
MHLSWEIYNFNHDVSWPANPPQIWLGHSCLGNTPRRIEVFAWFLLQNKIFTIDNFIKRGGCYPIYIISAEDNRRRHNIYLQTVNTPNESETWQLVISALVSAYHKHSSMETTKRFCYKGMTINARGYK